MLTNADAENLTLELFNKKGIALRLAGEEDSNFHIQSHDGDYLLKISHPNVCTDSIELQNFILQKLESSCLPFNVPRLQKTVNKEWLIRFPLPNGKQSIVRLLSFVPGKLFVEARPHTQQVLTSLGSQIGHLSQALTKEQHHFVKRYSKWDLEQANWISQHISQLESRQDQQTIKHFLDLFEKDTALFFPQLRQSIIHGDLNDYNILVSDELVSGFIDFGDINVSATVFELAIAIAYAIMDHPEPLNAASSILHGYHSIFPLQDIEIAVLFNLIGIRLCVSVVNSALRRKEQQHNDYLFVSEQPAWNLLRTLQGIDSQSAHQQFRKACGLKYVTN